MKLKYFMLKFSLLVHTFHFVTENMLISSAQFLLPVVLQLNKKGTKYIGVLHRRSSRFEFWFTNYQQEINALYTAESDEAIEGRVCENSNKETGMLSRISQGRNSNWKCVHSVRDWGRAGEGRGGFYQYLIMSEALVQELYVCEGDIWLDCSMSGSNFKITSRLESQNHWCLRMHA